MLVINQIGCSYLQACVPKIILLFRHLNLPVVTTMIPLSHRASVPFSRYSIVLVGTCVLNTCQQVWYSIVLVGTCVLTTCLVKKCGLWWTGILKSGLNAKQQLFQCHKGIICSSTLRLLLGHLTYYRFCLTLINSRNVSQ